jgi:hypothetical protein
LLPSCHVNNHRCGVGDCTCFCADCKSIRQNNITSDTIELNAIPKVVAADFINNLELVISEPPVLDTTSTVHEATATLTIQNIENNVDAFLENQTLLKVDIEPTITIDSLNEDDQQVFVLTEELSNLDEEVVDEHKRNTIDLEVITNNIVGNNNTQEVDFIENYTPSKLKYIFNKCLP